MKKIHIVVLLLSLFVFVNCDKTDPAPPDEGKTENEEVSDSCSITTKLIADGPNYSENCDGTNIGQLIVLDDGDSISVTFDLPGDGWVLNNTNVYIGPEADIPATNPGNPIVGQFPYKNEHDPGVTSFMIGPFASPDSDYVISAYAFAEHWINIPDIDSLCEFLPETVDFIFTGKGPDSYLNIDVSNGGWLNGSYNGWCIDREKTISDGNLYEEADVICSHQPLPGSLVVHPENIDLVNWIINNVAAGGASACEGDYTFGDIQYAIWTLIASGTTEIGLGDWSQCRADEIIANAQANGVGFEPACGEYLGVILDAENAQTCIIAVPYVCNFSDGISAGWAYGQNGEYCDPDGADGISFIDSPYYGGSSWGWYFYGCE
jgi:hypothetical protein